MNTSCLFAQEEFKGDIDLYKSLNSVIENFPISFLQCNGNKSSFIKINPVAGFPDCSETKAPIPLQQQMDLIHR